MKRRNILLAFLVLVCLCIPIKGQAAEALQISANSQTVEAGVKQANIDISFNNLSSAPNSSAGYNGKIGGYQILISYDSTKVKLGGLSTGLKSETTDSFGIKTEQKWDCYGSVVADGQYRIICDDRLGVGFDPKAQAQDLVACSLIAQIDNSVAEGTKLDFTIEVESVCDSIGNEGTIMSLFKKQTAFSVNYGNVIESSDSVVSLTDSNANADVNSGEKSYVVLATVVLIASALFIIMIKILKKQNKK